MTKTFLNNADNDLYLDNNGQIAIGQGLPAVLSICERVSKTQLGEMLFATNQGIPNFETVWVGAPNIPQFQAALRQALIKVPDVREILALDVAIRNNTLTYEVTILTTYGQGNFSGSL